MCRNNGKLNSILVKYLSLTKRAFFLMKDNYDMARKHHVNLTIQCVTGREKIIRDFSSCVGVKGCVLFKKFNF